MKLGGHVYLMTNKNNTVIYTGVSSALRKRVLEHKTNKYDKSFTKRYKCHKLVYYKWYPTIMEAIAREKQIKAGSREKKVQLINEMNPDWNDLFDDLDVV